MDQRGEDSGVRHFADIEVVNLAFCPAGEIIRPPLGERRQESSLTEWPPFFASLRFLSQPGRRSHPRRWSTRQASGFAPKSRPPTTGCEYLPRGGRVPAPVIGWLGPPWGASRPAYRSFDRPAGDQAGYVGGVLRANLKPGKWLRPPGLMAAVSRSNTSARLRRPPQASGVVDYRD